MGRTPQLFSLTAKRPSAARLMAMTTNQPKRNRPMTTTPELKCPKCRNQEHFKSEGNRHFCSVCSKFFTTRAETKDEYNNRMMRTPISTR